MDFKNKSGKSIQCKISCNPVRLCEFPSKELMLTVVYVFGKEPMLLLSNLKMQEKKKLCHIIAKVYLLRWPEIPISAFPASFRKLKYTIGLVNFHSYKPDFVKQEIWAKLIAYNLTESIINHTAVVHQKKTKHDYKIHFGTAAHICRVFLRPSVKEGSINVTALLQRRLIPIRNERQYPRLKTAHFRRPRYFIYRAA